MPQPYDPTGAMGGLFAPAYIHGNPESEAAVAAWQAANHGMTNPGVNATKTADQTIPVPRGIGGSGLRGPSTMTIEGSVDPEALRALAQGGKYTDTRDQIAATIAANNSGGGATGGAGGAGGLGTGPGGLSRVAMPYGGSMMVNPDPSPTSPLRYLMGEGDPSAFMQGGWAGGA